MKYLAFVTYTLGKKIFFEVKIFDKNNEHYVGSASVILKEKCNLKTGGYDYEMIYCDIFLPKFYMKRVSKSEILKKCKDVIES